MDLYVHPKGKIVIFIEIRLSINSQLRVGYGRDQNQNLGYTKEVSKIQGHRRN